MRGGRRWRYCKTCTKQNGGKIQKAFVKRRLDAGLCHRCGAKRDSERFKTRCFKCGIAYEAYRQAWLAKRRAANNP